MNFFLVYFWLFFKLENIEELQKIEIKLFLYFILLLLSRSNQVFMSKILQQK